MRARLWILAVAVLTTAACVTPRSPGASGAASRTSGEAAAAAEAVASGAAQPAETAEAREARRFTILQVNDVYKIEGLEGGRVGGLARLRTLRRELEAAGPVLLLHAGDALYPSVMSKWLDAVPMIECLNLLDGEPEGFDQRLLLTFGNHEFDRPREVPDESSVSEGRSADGRVVRARLPESEFRWLTSNVYYRPDPEAAAVPFHKVFPNVHHAAVERIGGLTVAIFALTVDDAERDYLHYDYAYGEESNVRNAVVRATLAGLAEHDPDVIVALTHQGMADDIQLARDFPEIDLVVGGHDHLTQRRMVGDTLITKADADAQTVYILEVDGSDPKRLRVEDRLVEVGESVAKDEAMQRAVERWRRTLAETVPDFETSFGTTRHLLVGEEPVLRGAESAMGNWLTDVARETLGTDLGVIQGGGIRINDNIPPGDIRGEDLEGIFYFDGAVVSFPLTGADLLEMLRNSVSRVHAGDGRFLQVSGLRYEYWVLPGSGGQDPSYRIEPEMVQVRRRGEQQFEPLDLEATYTMATLEHIWQEGARYGYQLFTDANRPELIDGQMGKYGWRAITEEWLKANREVTVDVEGRIRRVEMGLTPTQ